MNTLEQDALEVCYAIEKCGASVELTNAVTKASNLLDRLNRRRDFGFVIEQLQLGKKAYRKGWVLGGTAWITYVSGTDYDVGCKTVGFDPNNTELNPIFSPWIGYKTESNTFEPWIPSQEDMFATDWMIA